MQRSKDILIELQELSPLLAGMTPVNVFSVPEGYFEGIGGQIMAKIKQERHGSAGLLGKISKSNVQEVPTGYFEGLPGSILAKVKAGESDSAENELKALSPLLSSIEKAIIFSVPAGYFENFAGSVVNRINQGKPAKVVGISRDKKWMRYAVAAVITGIMVVSAWMIIDKPFASEGKKFLSEVKSIKKQYQSEEDIQNALASISDKDIIKYLETTGDIKDIELITPNINANELPSEADYFDEDFLDSFMKELESSKNIN